ncbi:MAG: ECF-type sigma factor [Bryobacteraceae bacterium]
MITRCLHDWRGGDDRALARLTEATYAELRRVASAILAGHQPSRTIQPTVLVHELFFQLPGVQHIDWESRAHFLNVAAKMMRNILVDHARRRQAAKRGAGLSLPLIEPGNSDPALEIDVLAVHEALERFHQRYPRQAQVVELRFFGGLSMEETCDVMRAQGSEGSLRTVERDWTFAKAWLQRAFVKRPQGDVHESPA